MKEDSKKLLSPKGAIDCPEHNGNKRTQVATTVVIRAETCRSIWFYSKSK
jgi:hypothetical protein